MAYVVREHKPYVSGLFYNNLGNPAISISCPVFYKDKFVGIVRWMTEVYTIYERFLQEIEIGKDTCRWLVDSNGIVLCHRFKERVGRHFLEHEDHDLSSEHREILERILSQIKHGQEGAGFFLCQEHGKRIVAYSPVKAGNRVWSVGISIGYSKVAQPIIAHARNTLLISCLIILLFLMIGVVLLRSQKRRAEIQAEAKHLQQLAQAAEELKNSEAKLSGIVSSITDCMCVMDNHNTILWANDVAKRLLGAELVGQKCYKFFGKDSQCDDCIVQRCFSDGKVHECEIEFKAPTGKHLTLWCKASVETYHASGKPAAVIKICHDITERKKMEEELKEREERYRSLFDISIDAILLNTLESGIVDCNAMACKMFGYTREELLRLKTEDLILDDMKAFLTNIFAEPLTRGNVSIEVRCKKKDGTSFPSEIRARLIRLKGEHMAIIYIRDITVNKEIDRQRTELQEQIRKTQKMEAIGTLAGGIAHDFNNMLTVINGHAEIALRKMGNDQSLRRYVELIKNAGEKAAQLTAQLLTFSRKQIYEPKIIDVNQVIIDIDKMLRRLISEDIQLDKILADDLPTIMADPTQMEQIMINLVVNARDAIHERTDNLTEKRIIIETACVFMDEFYVAKHVGSRIGPHVMIAVSDTGIGIDREARERIFEPFFSTKEMGRGTGLGLATVYGIVKQNGGCIYVYSEIGHGTTFKIYWPVSEGKVNIETEDHQEDIIGGNESILVVEDNEPVRSFMAEGLEQLGYKVFESSNGKEALYLLKRKAPKIDLLITDLIMPEMNGDDLAKEIKKIHPDIGVIFISGYTDNHIVHNGILEKGANFIQKPFNIQKLARKVRMIISKAQVDQE